MIDSTQCKHCGTKLIEKQTSRTSEQLKKLYYYTAYYYCPNCERIYHDDKFKIMNDSPTPLFGLHSSLDKNRNKDKKERRVDIEIWTDGACTNNGNANAKAAWAFVSGPTERAGVVRGKQTNNRAEALAIYHALVWAGEKGYKNPKVYTDSQITLYGLRKPFRLVKSNQEIFEHIAEVIEKNNLEVTFEKVLGHAGDKNNERADRLANKLAGVNITSKSE